MISWETEEGSGWEECGANEKSKIRRIEELFRREIIARIENFNGWGDSCQVFNRYFCKKIILERILDSCKLKFELLRVKIFTSTVEKEYVFTSTKLSKRARKTG